MKRHEELYLLDFIESASRIDGMIEGLSFESFTQSKTHPSAVLWQLTVIGEAAGRLSDQTRARLPHIPWTRIRAFRNRLVHGYFDLNWATVWQIATEETPKLRKEAEALLAELFPEAYQAWKSRQEK